MTKEMIINACMAEEIRIAIVENKKLIDLDIEAQSRTKHKGNIYKGIISNIEDGLEAVFVDFGEEKQAFLPLSDIRSSSYINAPKDAKKPKASEVLQRGQEIVIQITKDEIGTKGAAATTYLSLPGRYMVLMHSDESCGGISRKIDSEEDRKNAKHVLSQLDIPSYMAVIIRTAGVSAAKEDLIRDFKSLASTWEQVDRGAQIGRAPTLLYREPDLVVRTVRDYLSDDISKIHIDDDEEFEDVLSYFEERMPDKVKLLFKHKKKEPIFQHHDIEKSVQELSSRKVLLHSGGYIIIDETEALVAIDVNSGKSNQEKNHESTVYKTNLEATDEIARQLRLRNLGGIIVIDYIDMASRKHGRDIEKKD